MGNAFLMMQNGIYTRDANAVATDILSSKTAYVADAKITGTIPVTPAGTIIASTSNIILPAGQYLGGAQTIAGDADLATGNIKNGITIFNTAGSYIPALTTKQETQSYVDGDISTTCGSTVVVHFTYSSYVQSVASVTCSSNLDILSGPTIVDNVVTYYFAYPLPSGTGIVTWTCIANVYAST